MVTRLVAVLTITTLSALSADWSPQLAAQYLDSRQKDWFAWPTANTTGVPCLSCHTGMTYLMVRPALRHSLGENERTAYETGLLNSLKSRIDQKDAKELYPKSKGTYAAQATGVESILAALLLATENEGGKLSVEAEKAFDRMWSLQIREGKSKGAWDWYSLNLDPWETPDSVFYGAALAAIATGNAPSDYRARPEIRENISSLIAFLQSEQSAQPLHNRLMLVWASTKLPGLLTDAKRAAIADEISRKQQPDGGWTMESMGAWAKHENAPPSAGSNSYATALATLTLERAGASRGNPSLQKALDWLKAHQDRKLGYWTATSMNKQYEPDSNQIRFMQDAATGFATLALLEAGQAGK
jgi:squalene-hopene/tetraprenyl-beta-curcumene cyclase